MEFQKIIQKNRVNSEKNTTSHVNLVQILKMCCEQFGVWIEKSMYGRKYMGIQRATFLCNEKAIITNIWEKVKVPGHAEEVLAAVEKMSI